MTPLEVLEARRLMSVSLSPGGTLTLLGSDSRDDVITVSVSNGVLKAVDNGRTHSFAATKVKKIYADGRRGADTIRLTESVRVPATLLGGAERGSTASTHDELVGGGGNDRLVAGDRTGLMMGGGGNDVLEARGETAVFGGSGNDRIIKFDSGDYRADGGPGTDTLDASRMFGEEVLGNDSDVAAAGLSQANRSYAGIENWIGTAHADVIVGSNARNILRGGGGNDRILARGGNDEIYAGAGNDTLDGGFGNDALHGEDGNDTLFARDGVHDFLSGGYGTDKAKKDAIDGVVGVESFLR